jgi:hypothetical protein
MQLSTFAIQSLGFERIAAGGSVEAAFYRLQIFEIRGFTIGPEAVFTRQSSSSGTQFSIGVGSSVNPICNALLGHEFTKDEATWAKERRASPPYLVIHIGPTLTHSATQGFVKNEDGEIISYDTFAAARDELRQTEARILPSIEMALAVAFGLVEPPVRFHPVDATTFGITPDNVVVHDFRITGSASAYVSRPIDLTQLDEYLASVIDWTNRLDSRVARFYQLATRDSDDLKRFLYYFLAIEIETHRVFKATSKAEHLNRAGLFDPRTGNAVKSLIEAKPENWTNLADRFVWCVTSAWTHLSAADISEFKKLKKVRDDIAHGTIPGPNPASVTAVERLATKLHLRHSGGGA